MTKMEKLIVSADPETKQLIEEIQDAIADTIEAKIGEILSKKVSDIKIDSSKVKIDFSEILNNQKLIIEKLNKIENTYSLKTNENKSSHNRGNTQNQEPSAKKNKIDKKKSDNSTILAMIDYTTQVEIANATSDNGVFQFVLSAVNRNKSPFYLSDESGVCYGCSFTKLLKNSKSPFVVPYGNMKNLEVNLINMTYRLW